MDPFYKITMAYDKNNAKSNVFLSADPLNAQRYRPIVQRDQSIVQIGQ